MRNKKTIISFVLILLISIPIFDVSAGTKSLWVSAVNNTIFDFNERYLPVKTSNALLIPHFVLTSGELGASTEYNGQNKTFTVSANNLKLVFSLKDNNATSGNTVYNQKCILYNGSGQNIFYLPAEFICDFFGWKITRINVDFGVLLRICGKGTIVRDDIFVMINDNLLATQYNAFTRTKTVTPLPDSSNQPSTSSVSPTPSESPQTKEKTNIKLAFNSKTTEYTDEIIDFLNSKNFRTTFFLRNEDLENFEKVRRICVDQFVGVQTDNLQECIQFNENLLEISFSSTNLIMFSEGSKSIDKQTRDSFVTNGFAYWDGIDPVSSAKDYNSAKAQIIKKLDGKQEIVLILPQTKQACEILAWLSLQNDEFTLDFITPFELPINNVNDRCQP